MKILNALVLSLIIGLLTLSSCLKEVGGPTLEPSSGTLAINESVTLSLYGVESVTCMEWRIVDDTTHLISSGGDNGDFEMTCRFPVAGVYTVEVDVKNCKKDCDGRCKSSTASAVFTVQ
jgi:hypothetical protein